ncbi:TPA: peptidoglycan bridge formation glycyltransferase FemA/FemB family protein [Streptococcus suis]|nr:peptidoglycan bridge formation glycyltransferase FemA/FemB family protein [Streptococcus suis]HEM6346397.1 peptidoglycan bridge formation glycyltransferase FemA/FemB family protein [Streptococcus suis]
MAYTFKVGIAADEHDEFIKNSSYTNLLQSSQWAHVKSDWENERIGFFKDEELVGVASLLIRRLFLPIGFTMIYIPRGPVIDYQDKELVKFVLKTIKEIGKKKRSIFIKFDPFLKVSTQKITGNSEEIPSTLAIKDMMEDMGLVWSGRVQTIWDTTQPTFNAVLKSKDFSEELLSKRVRQNIRTARNKGIEIRIGREDLLDDFSDLLKKTEERKSIHLRGKEYYQKILDSYPNDAHIVVAYLDLLKRDELLSQAVDKLNKEAASFTLSTRQSKVDNYQKELHRIQVEKEFIKSKIESGVTYAPLAGTLSIDFGGTSENIYAGMDDSFSQYQAPLLTWFETAKYAFDRGVKWQNLGGVEPLLDGGLYHFKSRLNPVIEEYIGEFDLIVSPILYKIFQAMLKNRKRLQNKK